MKLEYDSKIRKGKLAYPERIIEKSLGKVPPSKDLIDKHLKERGNMYRTSLMLAAIQYPRNSTSIHQPVGFAA